MVGNWRENGISLKEMLRLGNIIRIPSNKQKERFGYADQMVWPFLTIEQKENNCNVG